MSSSATTMNGTGMKNVRTPVNTLLTVVRSNSSTIKKNIKGAIKRVSGKGSVAMKATK